MSKQSHAYDDIIHLPHPVSQRHPQMSMEMRAAQFAPFAALSGYEDVLHETERLTDPRAALGEDAQAALAQTLSQLAARAGEQPAVTVRYFLPDSKKAGGAYRTVTGFLKGIDAVAGLLLLTNGVQLPLADLWQIETAAPDGTKENSAL